MNRPYGDVQRYRENSDEIGRKPVGLAKSGEDTVLDILDPDIFINAHFFQDGVKSGYCGGGQNSGDEILNRFWIAGEMGDQGIKQDDVANS